LYLLLRFSEVCCAVGSPERANEISAGAITDEYQFNKIANRDSLLLPQKPDCIVKIACREICETNEAIKSM
jgi:hypothetical protein